MAEASPASAIAISGLPISRVMESGTEGDRNGSYDRHSGPAVRDQAKFSRRGQGTSGKASTTSSQPRHDPSWGEPRKPLQIGRIAGEGTKLLIRHWLSSMSTEKDARTSLDLMVVSSSDASDLRFPPGGIHRTMTSALATLSHPCSITRRAGLHESG